MLTCPFFFLFLLRPPVFYKSSKALKIERNILRTQKTFGTLLVFVLFLSLLKTAPSSHIRRLIFSGNNLYFFKITLIKFYITVICLTYDNVRIFQNQPWELMYQYHNITSNITHTGDFLHLYFIIFTSWCYYIIRCKIVSKIENNRGDCPDFSRFETLFKNKI